MDKIVVIAGPTAVGKTEYSIEIARKHNGEIISCDSMQLYKYMDIGSAKPTAEERKRAVHHLIDFADPREEFSVAMYQKLATEAISEVIEKGCIPVISGGTGLYLNSILYDMDFAKAPGNPRYRNELIAFAEEKGNDALHSMLEQRDPEAAGRIHPNNRKKVIRALERLENGEDTVAEFTMGGDSEMRYDAVMIGLTRDREELYDRINRRVDILFDAGLCDEVRNLVAMGLDFDDISMKGIGYKEVIEYLNGDCTLDEAVENVKKNTRHYAKRQLTWFRRYDKMKWFNLSEYLDDREATGVIGEWLSKRI